MICGDNILKTLINLCYNIPIIYIPKVLKIFDNILKDPSTINVSREIKINTFIFIFLILEIRKHWIFRMPTKTFKRLCFY